jgi:hypothetical protein
MIRWNKQDHVVTGVVKDMVMESPYKKPVASIFMMMPGWVNFITLRVKPTMPMQEALKKIEPVFKKYNPGSPFDFKFNDDDMRTSFRTSSGSVTWLPYLRYWLYLYHALVYLAWLHLWPSSALRKSAYARCLAHQ